MFQIVYADPPWDYAGQSQHAGKRGATSAANGHYPTMKLQDLKRLEVLEVCDKSACLLFMWTSSPHLPQAIELMGAWGFAYATVGFVWDKERVNPGYYTLSQCELCLIGKAGKIPTPRGARNIRQLIIEERGAHSVKPAEARTRIEQMFPTQKKLELFAREAAPGWSVFGNEVQGGVSLRMRPQTA